MVVKTKPHEPHEPHKKTAAPAAERIMPLSLAAEGQEVVLHSIDGGRELQHRLAELGLRPGVKLRILTRGNPGPFIVSIMDTRLLLGHGMVPRVHVRYAGQQ